MNAIPTLDLEQYLSENIAHQDLFIYALGEAFQGIGFACIVNHGIPQTLIDDFYALSKEFFYLPTSLKSEYEIPGLAGQRGYTSFGKEHAKNSKAPDLKEFFQIGQTVKGDDPIKTIYPNNVVVNELPTFTQLGDELFRAFENTGNAILEAIAKYLQLPSDYFAKNTFNGNSILRSIYYPPIIEEPSSAIRAEQHEDINLITLLVGASAGGLEVVSKGNWIPVNPSPGSIVINVGDMLQRLTNNYLKSTTHRVVNPPKEEWHLERLSIPFFLHPRHDMDLTCLQSCVQGKVHYPPIKAGEYLEERLIEIGLLKK